MKYNKLFFLFIACLSFGCSLPTVRYFTTQPFITAYKTNIDKPLTIVFDPNVKDTILINSSDISKMKVVQFRRTMEDILKTTFKNTYTEVKMNNTFSQNGISLVLVKVKPDWKKNQSKLLQLVLVTILRQPIIMNWNQKYPIRQLFTRMARKGA